MPTLPENYYQWLCQRKPFPMGRDVKYIIGLWAVALFYVMFLIIEWIRAPGSYPFTFPFISLLAVAYIVISTIIIYFGWMPSAFKEDLESGAIAKLLSKGISGKIIIAGLRGWALINNIRYILPLFVILAVDLIGWGVLPKDPVIIQEIKGMHSVIPLFISVSVFIFLIWLFVLETGLWISVLPESAVYRKMTLYVWIGLYPFISLMFSSNFFEIPVAGFSLLYILMAIGILGSDYESVRIIDKINSEYRVSNG
ncbi:MAG: hypothetical protein ABIC40_09180 [bacterium]